MTPHPTGDRHEADVLVVGAGSSGSVVAAELASRGVDVVVLEAGPDAPPSPWWSLEGAFDERGSVGADAAFATGRTVATRRGVGVGGSAAVNGCYWVRGTRADHADWVELTGDPSWAHERMQRLADGLEDDRDVADRRGGAIPVGRDARLEPVSEAFLAAAAAADLRWVADLNDGTGAVGVGLVPFNARDGRRFDPATALGLRGAVAPRFGGRLETRTTVERIVLDRGRVVGADAVGPSGPCRWRARHVVCSAGALGTARLLRDSGFGPPDVLDRAGCTAVEDLPVGVTAWDHPSIDLTYLPRPGTVPGTTTNFMQLALHLDDADVGGIVEVLPTRRPYGAVTGTAPEDEELSLRVTLMRPRSRVRVHGGTSGAAELAYGTLDDPIDAAPEGGGDLPALCRAVRAVCALAGTPEMAEVIDVWHGPGPEVLDEPAHLASWVAERVGTAYHLGGTAPMGRPDAHGTVVDPQLRVLGVEGLWVADSSVLPAPLRRGPAATVAALGVAAAQHVAAALGGPAGVG